MRSGGELTTRLSLFADRDNARFTAGLVSRLVLALSGGALSLAGANLLAAGTAAAGPAQDILTLLGYAALGFGLVLILRVVLAGAGD